MVGDRAPLGRRDPPRSGSPQSVLNSTSITGDPQTGPTSRRSTVRGTVFGMNTDQPSSSSPAPDTAAENSLEDHIDAREVELVDLADVSAQEIIFRSIVVLMSAA